MRLTEVVVVEAGEPDLGGYLMPLPAGEALVIGAKSGPVRANQS